MKPEFRRMPRHAAPPGLAGGHAADLLAVNAAFNPSFLHLEWRDGHLYGSLIDILNRAAPLVLVSLGMTLVIATRGIDISVGAVVAIAAALAAWMIGGSLVVSNGAPRRSRFPMWLAIVAALGVALACGLWNGLLVARVGMQPIIATLILMVAGRGIAQLITGGQIITIYYAPFFFLGSGYLLGLPFSVFIAAAVFALLYLAITRTRAGPVHPGGGHQPGGGARGRRAGAPPVVGAYAFCGFCAGRRGAADQLQRQERRRQQRRPAAGARRDPGRDAGRHGADRRALQPGRQRDRRADHPDADLRDLFAGRAAGDQPGGQGGGGVRRDAAAVGRVPRDSRGQLVQRPARGEVARMSARACPNDVPRNRRRRSPPRGTPARAQSQVPAAGRDHLAVRG